MSAAVHDIHLPSLQRNYRWFLCFVFSTTLLCVWVFALSLVQLLKYMDDSGRGFGHAISEYPASLVCMVYTFLAFWCARCRSDLVRRACKLGLWRPALQCC